MTHPDNSTWAVALSFDHCTRCALQHERTNIVWGTGNRKADLMFVGEGPGEQEDLQREPFVGPAGVVLNRMIKAMGLTREELYITNVVKCRPPGNRDPKPAEMKACHPWLLEQLGFVRPKVLVTLGRISTCKLTQTWGPMDVLLTKDDLECDFLTPIPVVPIYHPSYLLRLAKGPSQDSFRATYQDTVQRLQRAAKLAGY